MADRKSAVPAFRSAVSGCSLLKFFGPQTRLGDIHPGAADEFCRRLQAGERNKRQGKALSPATVAKRIERVNAFFQDALRRRLIAENPLEEVRLPKVNDEDRRAYVSVEIVERLIEETPGAEWKLLLAMATGIDQGGGAGLVGERQPAARIAAADSPHRRAALAQTVACASKRRNGPRGSLSRPRRGGMAGKYPPNCGQALPVGDAGGLSEAGRRGVQRGASKKRSTVEAKSEADSTGPTKPRPAKPRRKPLSTADLGS